MSTRRRRTRTSPSRRRSAASSKIQEPFRVPEVETRAIGAREVRERGEEEAVQG